MVSSNHLKILFFMGLFSKFQVTFYQSRACPNSWLIVLKIPSSSFLAWKVWISENSLYFSRRECEMSFCRKTRIKNYSILKDKIKDISWILDQTQILKAPLWINHLHFKDCKLNYFNSSFNNNKYDENILPWFHFFLSSCPYCYSWLFK